MVALREPRIIQLLRLERGDYRPIPVLESRIFALYSPQDIGGGSRRAQETDAAPSAGYCILAFLFQAGSGL